MPSSNGFGPIVDQVRESGQRSDRTGTIIRFVWHHQAGVNDDDTINAMVTGSREVSATYTVSNDNPGGRGWSRITGVVPERYRPWTSNSPNVDGRALTVECANSSGGPDWGIADESFEACARLAAYAYTEYGVPLRRITSAADGSGHIGHGELPGVFGEGYATFCPGHLDIDRILTRAAQLVGTDLSTAGSAQLINDVQEDDMANVSDAEKNDMVRAAQLIRLMLGDHPTGDPNYSAINDGEVVGALRNINNRLMTSISDGVTQDGLQILDNRTKALLTLALKGADVDEKALAAELLPLLVKTSSTADLQAYAKATADEIDRRAKARLEVSA